MREKPETKQCKHCKTEIPYGAKICPNCRKKQGGILKWVLIGIVVFGIINAALNGSSDKKTLDTEKQSETQAEKQSEAQIETAETTESQAQETETRAPETSAAPEMTMEQGNALDKAIQYLSFSAFSYSGLIEQLEFEGFSNESATYAVDNCGADWNEQAAAKAQSYLDMSSFSRSGLIEQLEFEGFTAEQAEYGATAVGY